MRSLYSFVLVAGCTAMAAVAIMNCSSPDARVGNSTSAATTGDAPPGYIDCDPIAGVKGYLPIDSSLSAMQRIGRCTWVLSTGRTTTNPYFATDSNGYPASATEGQTGTENLIRDLAKKNGTIVPILDLLSATSEQDRAARWQQYGVMNDPGCKASSHPDPYGLQLDTCTDPYSAGVVGFRKFPNPAFDAPRWAALQAQGQDALMQAYKTDPTLEPPYLVGQACGGCHTSFESGEPARRRVAPAVGELEVHARQPVLP